MATEKVDFELWLKSKFDGDALKAAETAFERTKASAEGAGRGMSVAKSAANELKSALGELVAVAAILSELKEGFEEVANAEQAFLRLSAAADRLGQSAEDVDRQFKDLAGNIQKASGLDDDALYNYMVKVYQATGDVNEAMGQAALAADVARGANVDLGKALGIVQSVSVGNTRVLRELGISVETTGDKSIDAAKGLDALRERFNGAAAAAGGMKVGLDKVKEEWGNVRNSFIEGGGELLGILLKVANLGLQPLFLALELAGNSIKTIVAGFRGLGEVVSKALSGDFAGAKETAAKTLEELSAGFEKAFDIIVDRAQKAWDVAMGGGMTSYAAPKPKGTGAGSGDKPKGDQDWSVYDKPIGPSNEAYKKEEEARRKRIEQFLKDEAAAHAKLKKLDADTVADMAREAERLSNLYNKLRDAELRDAKEAAKMKRELAGEMALSLIGIGQALFGESKELAIAEAIISTLLAANKVLPNYYLAAAVIAAGMANVAKISSTEPKGDSSQGRGFDNPSNDRAAYLGGRRWAADMIGEFTKGVSSGWASGMAAGATTNTNTYDQSRTYNVHLHGGLIDPNDQQMAKRLYRTLQIVGTQVEGQRATARR